MKPNTKNTMLAALLALALSGEGAVKNRSSGFFGQDIGLASPSEPVDGFVEQDIGF